MKILLAIILIFPIFNIVAQNPVQPKDSTVGKDELIIISPEKKVHSDTSELMIIRDGFIVPVRTLPCNRRAVESALFRFFV